MLPHIKADGSLILIFNDYDLPYACPIIEEGAELDDRFLRATYTAWKHLIRDPLIFDYVLAESRERESSSPQVNDQ